jgi:crotonobetainyl-CoA:carnitine CoA-transferase CaiB-like acyl-CoA transferase
LRLAERADVLIENFRPGTLETMGLAPDRLLERNPRLVIVRISGWGQDGPYRLRLGFGTLVEGMSGFAAKNGFADRPPVLPPTALADMIAGLYGAFATQVALRHRDATGRGQVIDLPLLDPIFSIVSSDAAIYRLTGENRPRTGSRSNTTSPRNIFATKDGRWISMSASMQAMVDRLYRALGCAEMLEDPRFRTNAGRVKHADAAEEPIRAYVAQHTLAEAMAFFEQHEITAAPVYDMDQFLADPHVRARQIAVDLPDAEMGTIPMHAIIPRLSETPGAFRRPAPELGEHTAEVLGRIGVDASVMEDLARRKIV